MKRLNRKQKLIVAIAIILIIIILAIVITTNIISNNSQIENEGYFATTANASSNLIASYIKKGEKIGGITGTLEVLDTSDADATPADIAKGKTAYVNGVKITGTREPDNYYFTDSLGNTVKVPGGFEVVNPEDNVTDGIIIEDVNAGDENTKGSQFVWIPVGDVKKEDGSTTTITLGRYSFSRTGTPSEYSGSYTEDTKDSHDSNYGNAIAKDIEDFKSKATTSHGYYIGRYEAGDALASTSARTGTLNVSNPNNPITCKSGVYPYNYVNQEDASNLARTMYSGSNFDSDLINSYAWDTAIVFIQTFSGDTNYSRQKGKNTTSSLQKCGESILNASYVDDGDEAQDVRCNIYDMAGNTYEWTTETDSSTSYPCVYRGGYYYDSFGDTSDRFVNTTTYSNVGDSFRPTLYL